MFFQKCNVIRQAIRLSLVLLMFSAILHATPINENTELQLQSSKQMPNPGAAWSAANGAFDMRAIEPVALPNLKGNISLQPSTATCLLISSCSNLVEVPEPPSSLLLGTGLLLTASMIRHRLLSRV